MYENLEKKCKKCGLIKQLSDFGKNRNAKDGLKSQCKSCNALYMRQYYAKNVEKLLALKREYDKKNAVKLREKGRIYRELNPEKIKLSQKRHKVRNRAAIREQECKYWMLHPDKKREKNLRHKKKNREKLAEEARIYYLDNIEACKKRMAEYRKSDYAKQLKNKYTRECRATPEGKINHSIGSRMRSSIKENKKGHHWESLVGYTLEDLIKHFKKTLPEGVTWDGYVTNMGDYHIDHKIPIRAFNFEKPSDIDFHRCWSLDNLQILPSIENLKKAAKLDKPFQPAFIFGQES